MSTSKHIDKICIAAVCLMLVLTILFMNGGSLGLAAIANAMKYESTLFDTSYVHKIDIVMDDWDSFIENCENEEYASCTVVIDGNQHKNTAIRAKGNTSLSSVRSLGSQRYSFKLEFDHYEEGKSCDGLDKLCLNNLIQDNTMMKDYIAYTLMNDFGVDSPLCSFAYITVNGEEWGLYLAVESVEDSFLQRNYGSDTGELYKPDSMSFGGGRGNGKDFDIGDFDFGDRSEDSVTSDETQPDMGEFSGFGQMPQNFDASNLPQDGNFQPDNVPQGSDFQQGSMPPSGDFGGFSGGDMTSPDGEGNASVTQEIPGNTAFAKFDFSTMMGGGFGSGNSDVKLQYIDDEPDSYPNIFDSAKTDVSKADQKRLISALKNLSEYADLENTLDVNEVLRYFVVHSFLVNGDSYTGNMIHNYYLHEKDGQLSMIPWDYNLAFGTFMGGNASGSVNDDIDEALSDRPMQAWIFSDEAYTEQYHALYAEFIEEWFTNGKLEKLIADTAQMLRPYVEKDPTKFCTTEEFDEGVDAIQQFVALRAEAVTSQLDGDLTAVETGDLNLSAMGSMGGGMGSPGGNMPQGGKRPSRNEMNSSNEDRPAMPSGMDAPGGNAPTGDFDPSGFAPNGNQPGSHPAGNTFTPGDSASFGEPSGISELSQWGLVGISAAVLIIGLLIAMKKKY